MKNTLRMTTTKLHRWMAVVIGLVLVLWVGSGLVMIGPRVTPNGMRRDVPTPDPEQLQGTVAPGEAIRAAREVSAPDARIHAVRFQAVGERWAYRVRIGTGTVLVDAVTGEPMAITSERALRLAEGFMQRDREPIGPVQVIASHDLWYPGGPLPVYRIRFDNGTRVHVDATVGTVSAIDRADQMRRLVIGLHDFSVLRILFRATLGHVLLWMFGLGALVVVGTGYVLAYPSVRRLVRREART